MPIATKSTAIRCVIRRTLAGRRISATLLAVVAGLVGVLAAPALPANAAAGSPMRCVEREWYDITSYTSVHLPAPGTHFKDGPGGTMTGTVQRSATISATASVTAGAEVSGIVASAKIEVSASVTYSKQITVGHTYSRNIGANKFGHLEYGSWGYRVNWRFGVINANCTSTELTRGTGATVPTTAEGWRYWETSS